jgi:hypothetical protein
MTKLTPPSDDIKNSNEQRILFLNASKELVKALLFMRMAVSLGMI